MVVYQTKHSFLRRISRHALFCAALTYIVFNLLNGNHGVYALLKEQHRLDMRQKELAEVVQSRQYMEHRVALLSDQSLDLDLLDERARSVLGYADKDEYIYIPTSQ